MLAVMYVLTTSAVLARMVVRFASAAHAVSAASAAAHAAASLAAHAAVHAALASAVVGSAGTPLRLMHASEPPTPPSDDLVLVDVTKP